MHILSERSRVSVITERRYYCSSEVEYFEAPTRTKINALVVTFSTQWQLICDTNTIARQLIT